MQGLEGENIRRGHTLRVGKNPRLVLLIGRCWVFRRFFSCYFDKTTSHGVLAGRGLLIGWVGIGIFNYKKNTLGARGARVEGRSGVLAGCCGYVLEDGYVR